MLAEFCQDVSDTQMPQVAPVILPQLLKVIVQPEVYSVRTRSRAVHIFNTISNFIYSMSYTFPVSVCGQRELHVHCECVWSVSVSYTFPVSVCGQRELHVPRECMWSA